MGVSNYFSKVECFQNDSDLKTESTLGFGGPLHSRHDRSWQSKVSNVQFTRYLSADPGEAVKNVTYARHAQFSRSQITTWISVVSAVISYFWFFYYSPKASTLLLACPLVCHKSGEMCDIVPIPLNCDINHVRFTIVI